MLGGRPVDGGRPDPGAQLGCPAAHTCMGFLISFDLYARAMGLISARRDELRAPAASLPLAAPLWSLTLWPSTRPETSKTRTRDDFALIGATHPARAWLQQLCPLLQAASAPGELLLQLTPAEYRRLYNVSRALAGLPPSTPHRLRHGGASADALQGATDTALADRGHWASLQSVRRYRQPTRYMRQLERLTRRQAVDARAAPSTILSLLNTIVADKSKLKRVPTEYS